MKNITDVPTFEVEVDEFQISFKCPKCRRTNYHGTGGSRGPEYGHRVSHCGCYPNGYFLKEKQDER